MLLMEVNSKSFSISEKKLKLRKEVLILTFKEKLLGLLRRTRVYTHTKKVDLTLEDTVKESKKLKHLSKNRENLQKGHQMVTKALISLPVLISF
jgi:hypothetical protein